MLWNQLDYDLQCKVYDRLKESILEETNLDMQRAIIAAISELKHWDNSSCLVQEENGDVDYSSAIAPIQAQDLIFCCDCSISWFCGCYCHKKDA
jgi:hypothetical protein